MPKPTQKQPPPHTHDHIVRIQSTIRDLHPLLNEFKSEAVQLSMVDNYIIPMLIAGEVRHQMEASIEYLISLAGKLSAKDTSEQIKTLELALEALKSQKASLGILIENQSRKKCRESDELQKAVNKVYKKMEKEINKMKEDDENRDRKKMGMDNLKKFLDILRGMNAQI